MKKKFISVLTALMVLSMSTTVFGATSPSTGTTTPVETDRVAVSENVTTAVTAVEGAEMEQATQAQVTNVVNRVATVVEDGYRANVAAVVNLHRPAGVEGPVTVSVTVPTVTAGADVFVLHIKDDGTQETLDATVGADGKITFTVSSFSTFAIVERVAVTASADTGYQPGTYDKYLTNSTADTTDTTAVTSPKTADAFAFIPMLAVICLAGVVVCTRRVKFN